jgi:hypothetical protein
MNIDEIEKGLAKLRKPGTNRVKPLRFRKDNNIKNTDLLVEEKIGKLPIKPDSYYLVPSEILRSSLFNSSGSKHCKQQNNSIVNNIELSSQKGINIRFSGYLLRQNEMDVWVECLDLLIQKNTTNKIEFKASAFLKKINRNATTPSKEWLFSALNKLIEAKVNIETKSTKFSGKLLKGYFINKSTKTICVYFDSKISILFKVKNCTKISKNQRRKLQKKSLSKWLHSYYLSHTNPHPVKIKTIMEYSGSYSQDERYFKKTLKSAIRDLAFVTRWRIYIDENDLLNCNKKKTESNN